MQEELFKATTLEDMLKLLYYKKEDYENATRDQIDDFYRRENILPKLDYVSENMKDVYMSSNEEYKIVSYFVLTMHLKELFCRYKEYQKAFNVNRDFVSDNLIRIVDKNTTDIHDYDKVFIIIEAISRYKSIGDFDDLTYNALKLIYSDNINQMQLVSLVCSIRIDEESYYLGFDESDFIDLTIGLSPIFFNNEEFNLYERSVLNILPTVYNYYRGFYESQNIPELLSPEMNYFDKLKSICEEASISIYTAIVFYESLCKILCIYYADENAEISTSELNHIISSFMDFMNNIKSDFCIEYEHEIGKIINDFMDLRYSLDDSGEITIIQTLIQFQRKSSTPKYKYKLINDSLTVPTYISRLFDLKEYDKIIEIYYKFKDSKNLEIHYFDIAYALQECSKYIEAKELYEYLLNKEETSSVCNNLGTIYETYYKDLNKAMEFYIKAIELNSNSNIAKNNLERIKQKIKDIEERPKKLKDLYFKKLKTWHRKVLFSIYRLSNNEKININDLAQVTTQSLNSLQNNLDYLEKYGMIKITFEDIIIDPIIEQLIKEYVDPQLYRQIIKVDNSKLFRPIFYHESEIFLYRALLELFPQHLVFPNISLKTIFEIDKMKEILDPETLKYLYMAHVDYAIINTSTYFPILAFEKDSEYNDTDYSKTLTDKKNDIFKIGGLPLIRLRFNSGIEYEKLKFEVREATKSLILEYNQDNAPYSVDLSKEFDAKRFGIVSSPIDLEIVKDDWQNIVGKAISQKSRIIDIEEETLIIELSLEIKPIIEMSESTIKSRLLEKYTILKYVIFKWY